MAPHVEIFWKIEIMRMISFFQADLRLSAHGTPDLRIAELVGLGMTLTQKPRMCIAPELSIANPCAWLRCISADYVQTNLRGTKLGWRKTKPSQKQGIRLKICVILRLTKAIRTLGFFGRLLNRFS